MMQNVTANWRWPLCVASEQTLFSYTVALDAMSVNYSCVTSCHLANEISVRICNSYIVGEKLKVAINQQKMYFFYLHHSTIESLSHYAFTWMVHRNFLPAAIFDVFIFHLGNHDFYKRTVLRSPSLYDLQFLNQFLTKRHFFVLNAGTIVD